MIKVELMEAYGTGCQGHKYWTYKTSVFVKGSVKRAINHAYKTLFETAKDREGFSWIPVLSTMKVYKDNVLIIDRD